MNRRSKINVHEITLMKPTFKKTELPNAAINLMSMFVLPSRKIDQKLIFSHSRLPRRSSLSYFMFPFIENIGFVVSRRPPLSQSVRSRECTWRPHFFSSRSVAKIHADFSRGPLHRARARALAHSPPPPGKKKTRRSLQTSHSFPAALSSRSFFILSTLPDVAVRETNL